MSDKKFEELLDEFEVAVCNAMRTGMARPLNIERVNAARLALLSHVSELLAERDAARKDYCAAQAWINGEMEHLESTIPPPSTAFDVATSLDWSYLYEEIR